MQHVHLLVYLMAVQLPFLSLKKCQINKSHVIQLGPHIFGHRHNFISLAVDQNIFKLQLYNEYGLSAHTDL